MQKFDAWGLPWNETDSASDEPYRAEPSRAWLALRTPLWICAPVWLCVEIVLAAGWWSAPWVGLLVGLAVVSGVVGVREWRTNRETVAIE